MLSICVYDFSVQKFILLCRSNLLSGSTCYAYAVSMELCCCVVKFVRVTDIHCQKFPPVTFSFKIAAQSNWNRR